MRTISFLPVLFFAIAAAFLSTGCTKHLEYGNSGCRECNITSVTSYSSYEGKINDSIHYRFSYNILGNPVSIITDRPSTGNPQCYFLYDSHGRLSQCIRPYGNGSYEEWDKYGYNSKDEIVYDTVYGFGAMAGDMPQPSDYYGYIAFTYDAKGRINHEHGEYYAHGQHTYTLDYDYNYNAAGNLINGAVYDEKLNLYRTNSVWMFMTRDYSVNNPFIATRYNNHYLPLYFKTRDFRLIQSVGGEIKVEYWCR